MKKSLLIIILFLGIQSDSQNGWFQQYILSGYVFTGIHFVNNNTGYVSGYNASSGIILKTTNQGSNWNVVSNINNSRLNSIFFINEQNGWVCGEEFNFYEPAIFRTTNGGINWSLQVHNGVFGFTDIKFNSDTSGWCIGWLDQVYVTTNAGNNWIMHSGLGAEANNIFFINYSFGWVACGGETGSILRTTNGGINWIVSIHQWVGYNSVYFANVDYGWAVGYYNDPFRGVISRTTNGGVNWSPQIINIFDEVKSVYFVDTANGWISADVYNADINSFFLMTAAFHGNNKQHPYPLF